MELTPFMSLSEVNHDIFLTNCNLEQLLSPRIIILSNEIPVINRRSLLSDRGLRFPQKSVVFTFTKCIYIYIVVIAIIVLIGSCKALKCCKLYKIILV